MFEICAISFILCILVFSLNPNNRIIHFIQTMCKKMILGSFFIGAFNFIGNFYGVHVPINFFTIMYVGWIGVPGMVSIVLLDL